MPGIIVLLLIALVVIVAIFGPLALIWSLNTLFSAGIAYTFKTWLASLVITLLVTGSSASSRKG